jgi:type I restriction enzyme S subunit
MSGPWKRSRLGNVCRVIPGYAFKSSDWQAEGIPVVKIKNITTDNAVDLTETDCVPELLLTPKLQKFVLNDGDILLAMTGATAGKVGKVRTKRPILLNQRVAKIAPVEADHGFIWSVVSSQEYQEKFFYLADGSAQPNMSGGQIEGLEIPCPPLPVQRRIAGILSAYDDLMENSQRRIRLLEAMAHALYREWFVHFRFPGHEKHPRVASPLGDIPQGWEVKPVADSFEISGGGTPSRKEAKYWDGGTIQWFSPSGLTGADTMFMDDSPERITELGLAESSARLFPAFSVMLTSRATIGAISINTHEACTNQGFITCLPNERVPLYFLFHWLTENVPTFERMASGATFKEISRGVFKTIEFIYPAPALVRRFESQVEPMGKQMLALQRQIQNLRRTRDLLLPRLLSGQIDLGDN